MIKLFQILAGYAEYFGLLIKSSDHKVTEMVTKKYFYFSILQNTQFMCTNNVPYTALWEAFSCCVAETSIYTNALYIVNIT